jgi:hypothetical protein
LRSTSGTVKNKTLKEADRRALSLFQGMVLRSTSGTVKNKTLNEADRRALSQHKGAVEKNKTLVCFDW